MRILVVDDDLSVTLTLGGFLESLGHNVTTAQDGQTAFDLLRADDFRLLICDWEMPGLSGLELCRKVRDEHLGPYVYIIMLTSHSGKDSLVSGLESGADDFISKPFEPDELRVRLRAAERIISLESRDLVIFLMARLAESRDSETGAHLERIREYSRHLARRLANHGDYQDRVDHGFIHLIYLTSPLHDIGKVGIPDGVLLKPGNLSDAEYDIMKQHARIGGETLDAALQAHPNAEFLRTARDIAWCHHEKFNGTGYPRGLSSEEIPLSARIVAVADVYDALTSKRTYKPAFSHRRAVEIIVDGSGSHFDPVIVKAFCEIEEEFDAIRAKLSGSEPEVAPLANIIEQFAAGTPPAAAT